MRSRIRSAPSEARTSVVGDPSQIRILPRDCLLLIPTVRYHLCQSCTLRCQCQDRCLRDRQVQIMLAHSNNNSYYNDSNSNSNSINNSSSSESSLLLIRGSSHPLPVAVAVAGAGCVVVAPQHPMSLAVWTGGYPALTHSLPSGFTAPDCCLLLPWPRTSPTRLAEPRLRCLPPLVAACT